MIRVNGDDPINVIARAGHHAQQYIPLIKDLCTAMLLSSPAARDKHVHDLISSRGGPNSWALYMDDGREFHFRSKFLNGVPGIVVYDRYRSTGGKAGMRKTVTVITTFSEARRFARQHLEHNVFIAKRNGRQAA